MIEYLNAASTRTELRETILMRKNRYENEEPPNSCHVIQNSYPLTFLLDMVHCSHNQVLSAVVKRSQEKRFAFDFLRMDQDEAFS